MTENLSSPVKQETQCSLCGKVTATQILTDCDKRFATDDHEYAIVRCDNCGLVRLSPRPDDQHLGSYYPGDFYSYRKNKQQSPGLKQRLRKWKNQRIVTEKLNIIHKHILPPGKLLDVGCAAGEFLAHAKKHGWEVYGIEYDSETARWATESYAINVTSGSVYDVAFPENLSVCTFWASLEHVSDPKAALEKAYHALIPTGILVILVPNYASWEARYAGQFWPHLDIPRHLYHFEPHSLQKLAESTGFKTLSITTPITNLAASHWPISIKSKLYQRHCRTDKLTQLSLKPLTSVLSTVSSFAGANHTLLGVFQK